MADVKLAGYNDPLWSDLLGSDIVVYTKVISDVSGVGSSLRVTGMYSPTPIKAAVLNDNWGVPGAVLASVTGYTTRGQVNILNISNINIESGITYWLSMIVNAANAVGEQRNEGYTLRRFVEYDTFEFSSDPTGLSYVNRYYGLTVWGTLASGGAGRLIGPSHRIGGASPLIGRGGGGIGW